MVIDRAIRTAREYLKAQPDAEHTAAWGHAMGVLECEIVPGDWLLVTHCPWCGTFLERRP